MDKKQFNLASFLIGTPIWIIFFIFNWKIALLVIGVMTANNLWIKGQNGR